MTENEIKVLKMNLLGGMYSFVMNCINDERLQDEWLMFGIPDDPDEDILETIAENTEEFSEIVHLFGKIVWNDFKEN